MRKIVKILIALPIILVLACYGCIRICNPHAGFSNIRVSHETTHVTEPLGPDGMVDFLAALNLRQSKGVTPENNAAVPLWRAAGPSTIEPQHRAEFFQRLGIDPLPDEGPYFISFEDFLKQHPEMLAELGHDNERAKDENSRPAAADAPGDLPDQDNDVADEPGTTRTAEEVAMDQQDEAMHRAWSTEEFPIVAAWLEANRAPLEQIVLVAERERYYSPLMSDEHPPVVSVLLPDVQLARGAARLLIVRAMHRLHAGDAEGAWRDLTICHHLSRHVATVPFMVSHLVGVAIDGVACDAELALARDPALTAEQRARFRRLLQDLPMLPNPADCLDVGERLTCLDIVVDMARDTGSLMPGEQKGIWAQFKNNNLVDWNQVLISGNQVYDRMSRAMRQETDYGKRRAVLNTITADVEAQLEETRRTVNVIMSMISGKARTEAIEGIMLSLMMPAIGAYDSAAVRAVCRRRQVDLAFALEQYRAEHGEYPGKLDQLVPQFFEKLPKDPFKNSDFIYQRQNGGYLLYSVGPNQTDDGGTSYDDEDANGDDFVVRVGNDTKSAKPEVDSQDQ